MKDPKVVKIKLEEGEVKMLSDEIMKRDGVPDPNDPDLEPDQVYCYLVLGSRKPQNEYEREMLKGIQEMKNDPNVKEIEIPFN